MDFIKSFFISLYSINLIKSSINFCIPIIIVLTFGLGDIRASSNDIEQYNNYNYHGLNDHCRVYDPYETLNRKIFVFNGVLDTFILRPFAKGYGRFTNDYTKNRVDSFVGNISEPLSTINYALQGNSEGVLKSFWRFAINTTFGLGGMFDIASKFDLTPSQQTFGNTLAHYGVGPGPYIVLPIYGGITVRDLSDPLISNRMLNPLEYVVHQDFKLVVTGTKIINTRSKIMPFTDYIAKNSLDPYITVREATFSQREAKIIYPVGYKCPVAN